MIEAQLFSTNAFSANAVSLNALSTFAAIYSQSIVNTNTIFTYFYQRKQISQNDILLFYFTLAIPLIENIAYTNFAGHRVDNCDIYF